MEFSIKPIGKIYTPFFLDFSKQIIYITPQLPQNYYPNCAKVQLGCYQREAFSTQLMKLKI